MAGDRHKNTIKHRIMRKPIKAPLLWSLGGILACITLIPAITSASGVQMWINLGAFLALYFGGACVFTLGRFSYVRYRPLQDRTATSFSLARTWSKANQWMLLGTLLFGLYWYDFSQARPHSWFSAYHYQYQAPVALDDGLETASLDDTPLNQGVFIQMIDDLVNDDALKWQHSVLISVDNQLLLEEYFYGEDKHTPHDLRSANKSLTSMLIGIAIAEGHIQSVNDSIALYFPEYRSLFEQFPEKRNIRIKDLLTMSAGLEANDWDHSSLGNENRIYRLSQDWLDYYLTLPQPHSPGEVYQYSTMGEMTLRALLVNATGESLQSYMQSRLLTPLGIATPRWTQFMYNRPDVGIRVELTSRALLKLGLLMINKGIWQGRQIIPQAWIEASTANHINTRHEGLGSPDYGYLWWRNRFEFQGKALEAYQAQGAGGQFIFAFPGLKTVLVFTSGNYNRARQTTAFSLIRERILPELCRVKDCR